MKKSFITLTTIALIFLMVFTSHPQVVFADEGMPPNSESTTVEETSTPEENTEETGLEQSENVDQYGDEVVPLAGEDALEDIEAIIPPADTENEIKVKQGETTSEQSVTSEESSVPSVPEVLGLAPEGTQLVIIDNEGQLEPLASQEAADIMAKGDPMWCPGNTAPGGSGCSASYSTFEELLANLGTYSGDGTIYVASTYDTGNVEPYEITIDGATFSNLGALTIQGGWDGATGGGTANIIGTSTFNKSLEIINWGSQVTLNDVIFSNTNYGLAIQTTGAVSLNNVDVINTSNSDGITVQAGGDVNFSDVSSTSNDGAGAVIDSGGDVSINGSSFNDNGQGNIYGNGLEVNAVGNITISNLTATGNLEGGALLNSNNNLTITNAVFNNNVGAISGYGVDATAIGNVTLVSVVANSNYEYGANITGQGLVDIQNSTFSGNLHYGGLFVDTNGKIILDTVVASNNATTGADLASGDDVLITNGVFSGNAGSGYSEGLEISSPGTVHLNSVNASNNGNDGIAIYDSANVILQSVTALGNNWDGAYVEADCTNVQVSNSNFSGNGFYGIEVATGQLTISGSQFINNTLGFISVDDGGCYFIPPGRLIISYTVPEESLPWNIVTVDDTSPPTNLDCNFYIGTILILKNGDSIKLPCPLRDTGSLSRVPTQDLPADLPEGYRYISGIKSTVIRSGIALEILDTAVTISFQTNGVNNNLVIFYWDGSRWQDLTSFGFQSGIVYSSGQFLFWDGHDWTDVLPEDKYIVGQAGSMTAEGYFEAVLNFTGIFVLTEKTN